MIEKDKNYPGILSDNFSGRGTEDYPPYDISIRTEKWKLIFRRSRDILKNVSWWGFISASKIAYPKFELYDLENDPFEQHNVAGLHPLIVLKLKKKLLSWDDGIERRKPKRDSGSIQRILIPYP